MKIIFVIFLCLLLGATACERSRAKFVINNQTADVLDSIKIVPNGDSAHLYTSLMPDESGPYYADLRNVHSEGKFTLFFKKWGTNQHYSFDFGHFSNGKPQDKQLFLEVWRDTILVKNRLEDF